MHTEPKVRAASAIASGAIVLGLALGLLLGLRGGAIAERTQSLVSVALDLSRPPPPPEPRPKLKPAEKSAPKGDPAPRNLKNQATQVVAPPVPFVLKPPSIVTAPKANIGDAASSGASDLPGPGQGAGGVGNGFGGGGEGGNGTGRGGPPREPPVVGPRQIRGKLAYRDIPEGLLPEGHGEIGVEVIFAVNPDGRVSECRIDRSSGYPAVDAVVCRLIEHRFVFKPAMDRFGRPVRSRVAETHSWYGRPE